MQALLQREWHWQEFTDALTERKRAVEAIMRMMLRYDLMLTPTAPLLPFSIDRDGPGWLGDYPEVLAQWHPTANQGGDGDPAAASAAEQSFRAALLYSRSGSSPWPVCG